MFKVQIPLLVVRLDDKVYDAFSLSKEDPHNTVVSINIPVDDISRESEKLLKLAGWILEETETVDYLHVNCEAYLLQGTYANLSISIETHEMTIGDKSGF